MEYLMSRLDNDLISRKALLEAIRPKLTRLYGHEIREIESLITNAPTIEAALSATTSQSLQAHDEVKGK